MADANIDADTGSDEPAGGTEPLIDADALAGVTKALGWLLLIGGAGLAATGVPLVFLYKPDDPVTGERSDVWWLRGAHSITSMLFIGAAAGIVAVLSVAVLKRLRLPPGWFVGLGALLVALVGLVSGQLIAWDDLAMEPVTDGSGLRGVADALSGDVRSVVVDHTEISRGTYAAWAVVHLLGVPLLALALAWIARRRARSGQAP